MWYDESNEEHKIGLDKVLEAFGFNTIEELVRGKDEIKKFDTSERDNQELVNAANNYVSLMEKAKQADDAVYDLNKQLAELIKLDINSPFETAEKSLRKLNRQAEVFASFSEIAGQSDAAAERLMANLGKIFGPEATHMFDASGRSFEILNRQIIASADNAMQRAMIEKQAADESLAKIQEHQAANNERRTQLDNLRIDLASHLDEADIELLNNDF